MATSRFATTAGEVKKQKLPAGRFEFFTREIYFPPECWDTTKESLKSSQLMDLLREGKGSGGHSSNVREMRRVWKNVEVR